MVVLQQVLESVLLPDAMRRLLIPFLCVLLCGALYAQKRKGKKPEEEPRPQVLEVLPEPPEAVTADAGRLSFQVSPLSNNGLLSQQVRDALKALFKSSHGGTIVKIRAFVSGSGDLRRIKDIVAEEFTDHKLPLPAVTTLQVGALQLVGSQVVIEATTSEKKTVNPSGLAFATGSDPKEPIAHLQTSLGHAGVKPADVLRVTCFLSSLDDAKTAHSAVSSAFPAAAFNAVQTQRLGLEPQQQCDAVARLSSAPAGGLAIENGLALVNSPKLVITATQLIFRDQDSDFRLAFQRLGKSLAPVGAGMKDVFWAESYALTKPNATRIESVQKEFLNGSHPPAGMTVQIEGLPSTDSTAAVELMALGK